MNKPISRPDADPDIGPLDEHGQQILSPEQEAQLAWLHAQPWYQADCDEADADVAAGRLMTHDEMKASMRKMKRRWFAEREIVPPPGYFDF